MQREFNRSLWRLYAGSPLLMRGLAAARGYICPWQKLWQPLAARLPSPPRILDIGCGVGAWLNGLAAQKLASGLGTDNNANAVAVAQKTATTASLNNDFKISHSHHDWPQENFNVISMIDVMHHIPPIQQDDFFLAAAKHVPAGGYFLYKDMSDAPWFHAAWNRLHDLLLAKQWISYFKVVRAEELAAGAGLTLVITDNFAIGPYAHQLRLWHRAD